MALGFIASIRRILYIHTESLYVNRCRRHHWNDMYFLFLQFVPCNFHVWLRWFVRFDTNRTQTQFWVYRTPKRWPATSTQYTTRTHTGRHMQVLHSISNNNNVSHWTIVTLDFNRETMHIHSNNLMCNTYSSRTIQLVCICCNVYGTVGHNDVDTSIPSVFVFVYSTERCVYYGVRKKKHLQWSIANATPFIIMK